MHNNYKTLALIALFGLLFAAVGWMAPAMYASYAPQDQFIEVHEFGASNATTADDEHIICFDRTVHDPNTATVFTELYIVSDNGHTYEVDSRSHERYFQQGDDTIKTAYGLPDGIEAGEYRYRLVVEMDLAQNRVTREFVFNSDAFTITESENMSDPSLAEYDC